MGLTRNPNGEAVASLASGAPRLPAEAAGVMDPADCALSSCFSLPSGSPCVTTDGAAEIDLGGRFRGNLGLRGCGHRGDGLARLLVGHDRTGYRNRHGEGQASGCKGNTGLLADAAGGGEIGDLAECAPPLTARFALRIAGPSPRKNPRPPAAPKRGPPRGGGPWSIAWSRMFLSG